MAGIKLHIVSKRYILVVLNFLKRNKKVLHVFYQVLIKIANFILLVTVTRVFFFS